MKDFLIFRSAKHPVVKDCIERINKEYTDCIIWLCIQEQCVNMYSNYNNIKFIVFPNGMFNYDMTLQDNKILSELIKKEFDEVYIPYSTQVPRCEEIEKIIVKLLHKKRAVYYGLNGNMDKKKIYIGKIKPKRIIGNIYNSIDYNIMRIIYLFFSRRKKND